MYKGERSEHLVRHGLSHPCWRALGKQPLPSWGTCPGEVIDSRRLKHLGSVGLLVDGANLVPQSPRRGVRGTIYNVLTFNLQGPIMGRNTSRRTKEPIASYNIVRLTSGQSRRTRRQLRLQLSSRAS